MRDGIVAAMTTPNHLRLIPPVGPPCQLSYRAGDGGYMVDLELLDGQGLPSRTRTPQAVPLEQAQALYGDSLAWRLASGWRMEGQDPSLAEIPDGAALPGPVDAVLLSRLQPNAWRLLAPGQQCRTAWRIGERGLRGAAEPLVGLLGTATPLLDYCLAWALGRLKDVGAAPALAQLVERAGSPPVARVARLAWLDCADSDARTQWAQAVVEDWPTALRHAWAAQDDAAMTTLLAAASGTPQAESPWARLPHAQWLVQLDGVAWGLRDTEQGRWARALLLQQVSQLQLGVGSFRAWRRLYKAAELRADGILFGRLVHVLESQRAKLESAKQGIYHNRKYIRAGQELAREDSTLAYTRATRNYFRRRSWRVLRRLGQGGDPRFVGMASGLLMAVDDAASLRWCAFNHLLYQHDGGMHPSRNGLVWQRQQPPAADQRLEAFPALWDQHPQALLHLLLSARSTAATAMAALALAQRDAWTHETSELVILRLLFHPQPNARRLGLDLALKRLDGDGTQWPALFGGGKGWLQCMLHAPHADVWQAALNRITQDPARYSADLGVVLAMLTAPAGGVRSHARLMLQAALAQADAAAQLSQGLLQWLTQTDPLDDSLNGFEPGNMPNGKAGPQPSSESRLDTLLWALEVPLRLVAGAADAPIIFALLLHPLALVRAVAAHWLLLLPDAQEYLSKVDVQAFLDSPWGPLRAAGVHLVGGMPEAMLLQRPAVVAAFCLHTDNGVRAAAKALVDRLAPNDAWADSVVGLLRERLFLGSSEADIDPAEGDALKQDVLSTLTGALAAATRRTAHGHQMRLLLAKSRGAQQLGAWLLQEQAPDAFTVRECAALAGVSALEVRAWALRALDDGARLAAQPQDGFGLFNSRWPEVRTFAQTQYAGLPASAWTIPTLLLLCDHTQDDAQTLGRQLLSQHFDATQIAELLPQLAQHPSLAMQTFVAQALVQHADTLPADDDAVAVIAQLTPYVLTVLSHVNRSRIAKDAVQQWLQRLSTCGAKTAQAVAALYSRLVLSDAQCDRTVYLHALNQLRSRYPEQESPMVQLAVPLRPGRRTLPPVAKAPLAGDHA